MEMRDKNSNYEKAYTVGLKAMMETLEQIRYYHYLEDVKKNLDRARRQSASTKANSAERAEAPRRRGRPRKSETK